MYESPEGGAIVNAPVELIITLKVELAKVEFLVKKVTSPVPAAGATHLKVHVQGFAELDAL